MRDARQRDLWHEQYMDVVGHHHIGMQNILMEFVLTLTKCAYDEICNPRIFQPERAGLGVIQMLVEIGELLA